jgi:hypothetical protein
VIFIVDSSPIVAEKNKQKKKKKKKKKKLQAELLL